MITLCWAAKGGSGTTVVAATLGLAATAPTLLVDLAGELPIALGLPEPDGPGVGEWLDSDAPAQRLGGLEIEVRPHLRLLPAGRVAVGPGARWSELADQFRGESRHIVIDAGTGPPIPIVHRCADRTWLVTRPCYLSLRAAVRHPSRPSGIVLVEEPGRSLRSVDVELAMGAPVVATILLDPAIARAVDAGLLTTRLPGAFRRCLRDAA